MLSWFYTDDLSMLFSKKEWGSELKSYFLGQHTKTEQIKTEQINEMMEALGLFLLFYRGLSYQFLLHRAAYCQLGYLLD